MEQLTKSKPTDPEAEQLIKKKGSRKADKKQNSCNQEAEQLIKKKSADAEKEQRLMRK